MIANPCERQDALLDYVYGECDPAERVAFEAHVALCDQCANELEGLRLARNGLATWQPPEPDLGFRIVSNPPVGVVHQRWGSPARLAAWGLAAAAVLVLAAAAALAQLEVRFGPEGFVVRTGGARPAALAAASGPALTRASAPAPSHVRLPPPSLGEGKPGATTLESTQWRTDLAALEQRLRRDFRDAVSPRASEAAARPAPAASAGVTMSDAELIRRVRSLVDESERRQQRELAVRLTDLLRDVETQRRTDLQRIQQGFGRIEGMTITEAARQRDMLQYLVRTASQR